MFASQRAEAEAAAARAAEEAADAYDSSYGEPGTPIVFFPNERIKQLEREAYCNSGAISYCTSP